MEKVSRKNFIEYSFQNKSKDAWNGILIVCILHRRRVSSGKLLVKLAKVKPNRRKKQFFFK